MYNIKIILNFINNKVKIYHQKAQLKPTFQA